MRVTECDGLRLLVLMLIMLSRQSFFSVAILQFHAFLFGLQKKQTEKLSSISLGG